jgi:predicted small metal-binding protein
MTGKVLQCGSIVPGCPLVIRGEDDSEVVVKFAEHARSVHGIEHLSDALRERVRAAVREDGGAGST